MTSKNITFQLLTHSVFNTDKEINEIESDPTSIQLTDESIGSETSVGTGRKGGVESYQVNVDSEVTILIGEDESVLNKSKAVGGYSDDPLYPADTAWNPSKIRMDGGDPEGIMSINIWLDNREGRDWLGRVEREGILLQSILNIYGNDGVKVADGSIEIDSCGVTCSPIKTLRILKVAASNCGYELKLVRCRGSRHEESKSVQ